MIKIGITWDEIRVVALQKMYLIEGSTIEENDGTKQYLAAMPGAYNEAVELLSTTNRFILKEHQIECNGAQKKISVKLKEEMPDLYQLKPNGIYFDDGRNGVTSCYDYELVGEEYLILNGRKTGAYHIFYRAYPLRATAETKGDTDMQLDDDAAVLIPLYIASQLYKDDDISIATTYRNEFEVGREALLKERNGSFAAQFVSKTGWF